MDILQDRERIEDFLLLFETLLKLKRVALQSFELSWHLIFHEILGFFSAAKGYGFSVATT